MPCSTTLVCVAEDRHRMRDKDSTTELLLLHWTTMYIMPDGSVSKNEKKSHDMVKMRD